MANMSYCRFENTYYDLVDCNDALVDEESLSEGETRFKEKLIRLCTEIAINFNYSYLTEKFK